LKVKEVMFGKNEALNRIGALIETPDFYNYLPADRKFKFAFINIYFFYFQLFFFQQALPIHSKRKAYLN